GAIRVERSYEAQNAAGLGRLDRILKREIAGFRGTSHNSVPQSVDRNTERLIVIGTAKESGIDQSCASGIEFRYEDVGSGTGLTGWLDDAGGGWEGSGERDAGDIGVAGRVGSDPGHVDGNIGEVGGVGEDGVDDEGLCHVVVFNIKGDDVVFEQNETTTAGLPFAGNDLVDFGVLKGQIAILEADVQIAVALNHDFILPLETHADSVV